MRRRNLGNSIVKRAIVLAMAFMMGVSTLGVSVITAKADEVTEVANVQLTASSDTTSSAAATAIQNAYDKAVEVSNATTETVTVDGLTQTSEPIIVTDENGEEVVIDRNLQLYSKEANDILKSDDTKNAIEAVKGAADALEESVNAYNNAANASNSATTAIDGAVTNATSGVVVSDKTISGVITTAEDKIKEGFADAEDAANTAQALNAAADVAEADYDKAKTALDNCQSVVDAAQEKYDALVAAGNASKAVLDEAKAAVEVASNMLAKAQEKADKAAKRVEEVDDLIKRTMVAIAEAKAEDAEANVAAAQDAVQAYYDAYMSTDAEDEKRLALDKEMESFVTNMAIFSVAAQDAVEKQIAFEQISGYDDSLSFEENISNLHAKYGNLDMFGLRTSDVVAAQLMRYAEGIVKDEAPYNNPVDSMKAVKCVLNDCDIIVTSTDYNERYQALSDLCYKLEIEAWDVTLKELLDVYDDPTSEKHEFVVAWFDTMRATMNGIDATYGVLENALDFYVASDALDSEKLKAAQDSVVKAVVSSVSVDDIYKEYTLAFLNYANEKYVGHVKSEVENAQAAVDKTTQAVKLLTAQGANPQLIADAEAALVRAKQNLADAKENSKVLLEKADAARELAKKAVYTSDDNNNDEQQGGGSQSGEGEGQGGTTPTNPTRPSRPSTPSNPGTPSTPAVPGTPATTTPAAPTTVATPVARRAAVTQVANNDANADADAVEIEETEVPAAVEEVAEEVVEETPEEEIVTIEDEKTPEAAEVKKMNWWWLIILAILAACGITYYGVNKKKKNAEVKIEK